MLGKIRIKEIKKTGLLNIPRFTLELEQKGSIEVQRNNTYEVLSRLIGDSDVIIELDSSLLSIPQKQRESYALEFLENIRALDVEYRCSKTTPSSSYSFFDVLFGNKKALAQSIVVYIPNKIWHKPEMKYILSLYGARYLVPKEKSDTLKMLEDLQRILDIEMLTHYRLIAFSVISCSSIGIFTSSLDLPDMKKLLGIT